ncbi:MAG TPA: hypothetical protein VNU96_19720 [Burkholderiales bacterium]|nr:hypothetical protein [Burkholderiales bacterium]
MSDFIVKLEVIAVFRNGQEVALTARIGRAQPEAKDAWVCPVEFAPVYQQPMSVKGVDSFHATWLACSLVLKLLGNLKSEGVELKALDGTSFPLEAYLAGLDAGPQDAEGG